MAKKNLHPFRAAKRAIAQYESASRADRVGDYRVAQTANDALFRNLVTTQRGVGRTLNRQNLRTVALMQKLARNLRVAGAKDENSYERSLLGDSGGMLAGYNQSQSRTLKTDIAVGNKNAQAGVQVGAEQAAAAKSMLHMAGQETKQLQASADYETSRALSGRTQQDAAQAAQMRFELAQARMQAQLQIQQMEKQAEIDKKQFLFQQKVATKTLGRQQLAAIDPAIRALAGSVPDLLKYHQENPDATYQEVLQHLTETGALPAGSDQFPQVQEAVRTLMHNTSVGKPDDIAREIIAALTMTPGWEHLSEGKEGRALQKYVEQAVKSFQSEYNSTWGKNALTSDSGVQPHPAPMTPDELQGDVSLQTGLSF